MQRPGRVRADVAAVGAGGLDRHAHVGGGVGDGFGHERQLVGESIHMQHAVTLALVHYGRASHWFATFDADSFVRILVPLLATRRVCEEQTELGVAVPVVHRRHPVTPAQASLLWHVGQRGSCSRNGVGCGDATVEKRPLVLHPLYGVGVVLALQMLARVAQERRVGEPALGQQAARQAPKRLRHFVEREGLGVRCFDLFCRRVERGF